MATCKEVHASVHKGVTTVVRCDQLPADHGTCHTAVISWYAAPTENWQPGDVVVDSRSRIFYRTICGYWYAPGESRSYEGAYPTRPLVKLVPEQTP